ncbi:MAG TPA: DNA mismatch repair protein MutS, partial [bacterium]|nr:DNA mismatch repair protein MutS [bacterium]
SADAHEVKASLNAIEYSIIIGSGKFRVKRYEGEPGYSVEVEKIFEKFQQTDADDYLVKLPESSGMSHIDAKILEFVSKLYPEPFVALDRFCENHLEEVPADTIQRCDREIQFYIATLEYIAKIRQPNLFFCYPEISTTSKVVEAHDTFDLALAYSLRSGVEAIIPNDFSLTDSERVMVVTGPNQGGKTTFARLFGQLHYLASLGFPVPGTQATLFLPDKILTHFEREENTQSLRGKLEDDLIRIHELLEQATSDSIVILNEIFAATALQDAIFLSQEIMNRLLQKNVLGVWVTFLDELTVMSEQTVSMVATIDPEDPTRRTFRIIKKPADGLAYALSLVKKHRLTSDQIEARLQ